MIRNRRAYQLIQCRTHSRLLAGAAAMCAAACGASRRSCVVSSCRGGAPLPTAQPTRLTALWSEARSGGGNACRCRRDPAVTLSVIVPVRTAKPPLLLCLDSILQQQDTDCTVQLIVVDSDSTDGTAAVLERYRHASGVVLRNCIALRSAAAARNEGLRHAVGRWLMFVDKDDLLPGAIRTLLEAAQRLDADVQGGWQYL